jgi:N-acetylglutamate synthase-like GNAT family acetyltransferase
MEVLTLAPAQLSDLQQDISQLVTSCNLSSEHLSQYLKGWAVFNQNELVGFTGIEKYQKNVHLQSLAVRKDMTHQGIGTKLVKEVQNYFVRTYNSHHRLFALTLFWNLGFYYRLGFIRIDAKQIKAQDPIAGREKHKYCTALSWVLET